MYNVFMKQQPNAAAIADDIACQSINWPERIELSEEGAQWLAKALENPPPHSEFFLKALEEYRREYGEFPSFDSGF
jgi:uncharacterized protein (DUF1778 family)